MFCREDEKHESQDRRENGDRQTPRWMLPPSSTTRYSHFVKEEKETGLQMKSSKSLLNEHAIFSSLVKRLFSGTIPELLGELFQNAQRSGTSHVDIRFPDSSHCVIADNGHGLMPGSDLEGLRKLLVLADSLYLDQKVTQNQNPMGVGLYSLIANEHISALHIQSNGLSITIDTRRWLCDHEYREAWEEHLATVGPVEEHGFRITITAAPSFIADMRACLLNDGRAAPIRQADRDAWVRNQMSPVCGYADLLSISLDGALLDPVLPSFLSLPKAEIQESYQGSLVRISLFCQGCAGVAVNWFGQIVVDERPSLGCQAYLVVRSGQPLHPQAPARKGLIADTALKDFYHWVRDRVFAWVCAQEQPAIAIIKRLYEIDANRAHRECPFAIVKPWMPLLREYEFTSYEDYTQNSSYEIGEIDLDLRYGPEEVVRKTRLSDLVMLREEVVVPLPGNHPAQYEFIRKNPSQAHEISTRTFHIGLTSLLQATDLDAYFPVVGAKAMHRLWWCPGPMIDNWHTTALGEWGVGTIEEVTQEGHSVENDIAPLTWHQFLEGWIFVASETVSWRIQDAAWVIGLDRSEDLIPFLRNCGYAAFVPGEDDEDSEESYAESVANAIRTYQIDTIAYHTDISGLCEAVQKLLQTGYQAHEASWQFVHRESFYADGRSAGRFLSHLLVTFPDGYSKKINLS